MATYINEPSHTFNEYLLIPGYSSCECIPANVSLKTPLVKFKKGEEPAIELAIPMVSAIMQAVSGERLAVELARNGGVSFIYGSQTPEDEAAMVARVKAKKAGFVFSDSNLAPVNTLADILALKAKTGHSTVAITEDGTPNGKLVGIVSSRDYRVSRMDRSEKIADFMTPLEKLVIARFGITLSEANDIIWDNKINSLPVLYEDGRLYGFVFRKDYDSHRENPDEMLDAEKRFVVGAGINSRDYEQRVPLLVNAGADVLCIGCGLGMGPHSEELLKKVLENNKTPAVIDADGLNLLAKTDEWGIEQIRMNPSGYVLTPHMKEMSRLTGYSVQELKDNRRELLRKYTEKVHAVCVLKDSRTLVKAPEGRLMINTTGNAAMAKAGSGDVLAGMITGLMAQHMRPDDAAVLGVYLHGLCGDHARKELGSYSVLAGDLLKMLGRTLKELEDMTE